MCPSVEALRCGTGTTMLPCKHVHCKGNISLHVTAVSLFAGNCETYCDAPHSANCFLHRILVKHLCTMSLLDCLKLLLQCSIHTYVSITASAPASMLSLGSSCLAYVTWGKYQTLPVD